MQFSNKPEENHLGKQLFGVSYRNAPQDFNIGIKTVERKMRLMEKITIYFLPLLGAFMLIVCLLQPPIGLNNGQIGIRYETLSIFLFGLLFVGSYAIYAGPIYFKRKQWLQEIHKQPISHFYGHEKIFSIFQEPSEAESNVAPPDLLRVATHWSEISNIELKKNYLLLFIKGNKAIVIPDRDFQGEDNLEQLYEIILAIIQPPKQLVLPIAAPR